jgi:DNA-directed RNA polymerase specialized sigma24 family protein
MQNTITLNELYADYSAGLLKKEDFEAAIFRAVQDDLYRRNLTGLNKEDHDDFVSWLYFRLGRAINSYRETGSSFEKYIGSMIRLTAKEYRSRQIRDYFAESAAWITQVPEMNVREEAPEYNEFGTLEIKEAADLSEILKTPRQLLILILKCCNYISPDLLERITPKLDISCEVLNEMIGNLTEQRKKRETEAKLLRERANCQFYRCILYEKKLKTLAEGSNAAIRAQGRLERSRNRLNKMRKQLAKMRFDPSNYQIAKLLGITKGTVDSVLYNIKSRWNNNKKLPG